ncbi:DNA/RNA non-specific endonuclease [Paraburkholderia sp. SIMBA_053]|uniref:DNA/RNA non-specific endonuclease n=1 Tax=Paraburkholderia sp. SIMBA_053 TaxID=3085794 RepID=UPI00397BBA63
MFDLAKGELLALHFGGAYHQINYAVPSAALAEDGRVVNAGVLFAGRPSIDPGANAQWWNRADAVEAHPGNAAGVSSSSPADRGVTRPDTDGHQTLTLDIPLRITISVNAAIGAATHLSDPTVAFSDNEALKEPKHETDYSSRLGYDETFLDQDQATLIVALPVAADESELAQSREGGTVLDYQNFSIAMHAKRRLARFTASNVTREPALRVHDATLATTRNALTGLNKGDSEKWFLDPRLDAKYQLPDVFFTKDRQAFDKGHIVRREDVAWGTTFEEFQRANGDSFHVTNCSPQGAHFNRSNLKMQNWGSLENLVLKSAATERLCVFAGPVLRDSDETFVGVGDGGSVIRAKIPSAFWKIVVARVGDGLAAYGFVLQQDLSDVEWEFAVPDDFKPFLCEIREIETATNLKFSEAICGADQFFRSRGADLDLAGIPRKVI